MSTSTEHMLMRLVIDSLRGSSSERVDTDYALGLLHEPYGSRCKAAVEQLDSYYRARWREAPYSQEDLSLPLWLYASETYHWRKWNWKFAVKPPATSKRRVQIQAAYGLLERRNLLSPEDQAHLIPLLRTDHWRVEDARVKAWMKGMPDLYVPIADADRLEPFDVAKGKLIAGWLEHALAEQHG